MRIVDYILHHGGVCPEKTAVVAGYTKLTYGQLAASIRQAADVMVGSQSPAVVFRTMPTEEFVITYFAAHLAEKVAVPLEKDISEDAYKEICARVSAFQFPHATADVLFTTGTTGRQKGVMISHEVLVANAENFIYAQGYSPETVFVISGPLNHIGSLSHLYPTFLLGGTVVLTEGMKDVNAFYAAFDYPSTKLATFLVPASIRILLLLSGDRLASYAEKIDFIETGAAAISQNDMQKLCGLLPHTRLFNTYASIETGIITTYNFNDGACVAGCVGKEMRHSSIVIENDKVVCKGKTLMTGYLDDEQLTQSVLYDGGFHTNDIGWLDDNGMLHITGRDDDIINVGGYKVAPVEVENHVLQIDGIADCICVPHTHPILGTAVKLLYVPNEGADIKPKQIADSLSHHLESYKIPTKYTAVESIVRTFNGKLNRKHYVSVRASPLE